jgi:hypothetical protein
VDTCTSKQNLREEETWSAQEKKTYRQRQNVYVATICLSLL